MGPYFSIPCFFKANNDIDYGALENYCSHLISYDSIDTLYTMAYNTRFRQLSHDEIFEVNKLVCDIANSNGKKAVIGHPYTLTNKELAKFSRKSKSINPYAISVLYPERYYNMNGPILDFLSTPVQEGLNIMIHEMKLVSGFNGGLINWPESLLKEALDLDGVVAIKEDSKNDGITELVNRLCNEKGIEVIVAGGGKVRLRKLVKEIGLRNWLNGSLMLFPYLSDKAIPAYLNGDDEYMDLYEKIVEQPFFEGVVSKFGWHLAHKAGLAALGYCELNERAPMPVMSITEFNKIKELILDIDHNAKKLLI